MKIVFQLNQMDCGPACLATVSAIHGKNIDLSYIRERCFIGKDGISLWGLKQAAEGLGFEGSAIKTELSQLTNEHLPCILHWNENHYVVLCKIKNGIFGLQKRYDVADPGYGMYSYKEETIKSNWVKKDSKGIALLLKPTEEFFDSNAPVTSKISIGFLLSYLKPYNRQVLWMVFLLFLGTALSISLPILTQKMIDYGIENKDLSFTVNILLAQLAFYSGIIAIGSIRNWITLLLGTKINIDIISDFIKKSLKLPLKYFDTRLHGDFSQRISDHNRIETFLTSQSTTTLFSIVTLTAFLFILFVYNKELLVIYLILTFMSLAWTLYWLNKRKMLDHLRFQIKGENQQSIFEIISGVADLKLNSLEEYKSKQWTEIQRQLFKINVKILKIEQTQISGFEFINQFKNVAITFLSSYLVITDQLTLGVLISVSYIVGQLNGPLNQLVSFFRSLQDAKLSIARLNEVQVLEEEEKEEMEKLSIENSAEELDSAQTGIRFQNVSFRYLNAEDRFALQSINLIIPKGKVTAIVGESGSGKTTLMKLLLKLYDPTFGEIYYNDQNISNISPTDLRQKCGVVMQESFIFSDTIERNIAGGCRIIDQRMLNYAIKISNLTKFIDELPMKEKTKIGEVGLGMSGGQKQRIMIARAVYKNPNYIFLDEATSALDAENEKIIHDNLQSFFNGKTAVIIAHRLSTVKKAEQIIVLKNGRIIEIGNHASLVAKKSDYYNLIKNQLELSN